VLTGEAHGGSSQRVGLMLEDDGAGHGPISQEPGTDSPWELPDAKSP
jgi:hypothetical protein